jgi:tyrosyl-tRNA synthetase
LNTTDVDAEKYIKIFTWQRINWYFNKKHKEAPHLRALQRKLAEELTTFVHSANELEKSIKASNIHLEMQLRMIWKNWSHFLRSFDGVPQAEIARRNWSGVDIVAVLNEKQVFKSNEARRALLLIHLNKEKSKEDLYFLPKI